MVLLKYNQKRNFKKTPEPGGTKKSSEQELIFVVQEHDATRLHYDFRLEIDGVLKSWAIPKGPSMNPADKRLAIVVEDHPYSYKDFEGTIPEGNYGAGNVIVWDNGTYNEVMTDEKKESEKKLLAGLKKGHITFILNGKKLKGEFALIKLRGKQENAWLLVKANDQYAIESDILKKDRSVITKKKLKLKEKPVHGHHPAIKNNSKKKESADKEINPILKSHPLPSDISPMLATLTDSSFDSKDWVYEIKYDGYRTLAIIEDGEVNLLSRNNLSFNKLFEPLLKELKKIDHTVILDGEVVVEDEGGHSNFQLLQNYQTTGKGTLKYYVFDILNLDGQDTRILNLLERKELLKLVLKRQKLSSIYYSDHIKENGKDFYKIAVKNGLEGIMAKRVDSIYNSGKRTKDWLKIKIIEQEEATIAGITEPKGNRQHFGSLLLGAYRDNEFQYIGNCGTGFSDEALKDLYKKIKPYFTDSSPFKENIKSAGKIQWVKPKLICQVKFSEWTNDGIMRHPVFVGLRIDKKPEDVMAPKVKTVKKAVKKTADKTKTNSTTKTTIKKIKEKAPLKKKGTDIDLNIGKVTLHLTNQQKIYFPKDKITKGDIVNYYKKIAPFILPYLKDRPQSMNRFPNGITGPSFFQKDVDRNKVPDWLKTEKIYSGSTKEYIDYLICNDTATLMYMANLGCIEINPWNSQVKSQENPDWAVIDLDPENIAFTEVVRTALEVKKLMDEYGVDCYCKTSGASGLHIYIPLAKKYDYDIVKTFSELVAKTVNSRIPEITSILRSPKKRQKKVYLDFLQNRRGQTLAAPYSVRPKPGATVSTPLEWKEVNNKLDPKNFTMKNILKRLDKKGDLWKPVLAKGVNLMKILKKINTE